jgi:hypothetical protein
MGWRCGSSCRAPALEVQSPEFKAKPGVQNPVASNKVKTNPAVMNL